MHGNKNDLGANKISFNYKRITACIVLICYANITFAHSGNTDSNGCHNDNVHGGYHCHNDGDNDTSSSNVFNKIFSSDYNREDYLKLYGGIFVVYGVFWVVRHMLVENDNQKKAKNLYKVNIAGSSEKTIEIAPVYSEEQMGVALSYNF